MTSRLKMVDNCFLPKLSRNLEECEKHPEIAKRDKNLAEYFQDVINSLGELKTCSSPSTELSSLLLLYYELSSDGPWNTEKCKECARELDDWFQLLFETSLPNSLKSNKLCKGQDLFDKSMEMLHKKLTPDDFKKYPGLIDAYCSMVKDINDYEIVLNPISVLPVSLLLIEDFMNDNRLKGLKSCLSILKCLTPQHFKEGNYYEVVHRVFLKIIVERDLEITQHVLECALSLINLLQPYPKVTTADDVLENVLGQMYTESNLYRKKAFCGFLINIIPIHKIHCAAHYMLMPVICDNLDICGNNAVAEILLVDVIQCLETWIQYCWCVWQLYPNKKLLSMLIRTLYTESKQEQLAIKIQNIFTALCKLSTTEEQEDIRNNIEKLISNEDLKLKNELFVQMIHNIQSNIALDME